MIVQLFRVFPVKTPLLSSEIKGHKKGRLKNLHIVQKGNEDLGVMDIFFILKTGNQENTQGQKKKTMDRWTPG